MGRLTADYFVCRQNTLTRQFKLIHPHFHLNLRLILLDILLDLSLPTGAFTQVRLPQFIVLILSGRRLEQTRVSTTDCIHCRMYAKHSIGNSDTAK